jgi:tRNA nucleotidyltransferase (CCA-adding enzyme)
MGSMHGTCLTPFQYKFVANPTAPSAEGLRLISQAKLVAFSSYHQWEAAMRRQAIDLMLTLGQQAPAPNWRIDAHALSTLCIAVQMGELQTLSPGEQWSLLSSGLMTPHPGQFVKALRDSGGLKQLLPEVNALFGVPQLSDMPEPIDVGQHQLQVLEETARAEAPLTARFAALMHKIGKGGTLPEIWPSHYKHEQRAHTMLDQIAQRMAVPDEAMDLARLVVDECDRVHRASDMRAGPIAAMLERLQASECQPRFDALMMVCACDWAAYPGHTLNDYPKAARLRQALAAYVAAEVQDMDADAAMHARATAIAHALRGQTPAH